MNNELGKYIVKAIKMMIKEDEERTWIFFIKALLVLFIGAYEYVRCIERTHTLTDKQMAKVYYYKNEWKEEIYDLINEYYIALHNL